MHMWIQRPGDLLGHFQKNWGSPYSEDLLSSKKLLVNFNFKTTKVPKTSPWAGHWAKVSKDALCLWVQCLNAKWDRTSKPGRRQPTKVEGETLLEQCYLVFLRCNLGTSQSTSFWHNNSPVHVRLFGHGLQEWHLHHGPENGRSCWVGVSWTVNHWQVSSCSLTKSHKYTILVWI